MMTYLFGAAVVPSGSWNAVVRVDNPEIQEDLLNNVFCGVSLNNRVAKACKANLHGQIHYKDVADAECVLPLRISFVPAGANGYGLHVMDYDAYIHKSKLITQNNKRSDKKMSFNLLKGLKDLLQQAEADLETNPTEPVIQKSKQTNDDGNNQSEPVIQKQDPNTDDNKPDDQVIKNEINDEELEAKIRVIVEKILAEKQGDQDNNKPDDDSSNNNDDDDEPKIQKSKVIQTTDDDTQKTCNYFELTNRDPRTGLPKQ